MTLRSNKQDNQQHSSVSTLVLKRQRVRAALANLYIGDALSMPVHWFYNPGDILRRFGKFGITGLEAAPETHPSSIMSLHSTTSGGRSRLQRTKSPEIVGDVILKGRQHLWGRPNGHYHDGMRAGDNTLNAWWAHWLTRYLLDNDEYHCEQWINTYVEHMTAEPPAHPDTYAESCHREFFANMTAGKPLLECGAVTHDTPSMGALVTVAPLALALLGQDHSLTATCQICKEHVWLTHPDKGLMQVVEAYVTLMHHLLNDTDQDQSTEPFVQASRVISGTRIDELLAAGVADNVVVGRTYSLACYITDSWPSVCFLAAKYRNDVNRGLLTNTNLGGENAHRGSVLGSLLGLASGQYNQQWYEALTLQPALDEQLNQFLDKFYAESPDSLIDI